MKTFFTRLATGLVGSALVIFLFLFNSYTFLFVMAFILLGSLNEYFNLTEAKRERTRSFWQSKWFVMLLSFIALMKAFVLASPPASGIPNFSNYFVLALQVLTRFRDSSLVLTAIVPAFVFLLLIIELYSKSERPFENLGWKIIPVFWILVPVLLTVNIYFSKGGAFIVAMFFAIWMYDSFCYIFGSLLGRTKLFPRVSPKKTWEGAIGGAVVTLIAAYFANKIPQLQMLSNIQWVILVFIIIVSATYGDLVESLLKRSLAIKDSGSLMPGHGGFLDRMDSYFLVVPFVAIALWFFTQVQNLLMVFEYLSN